MGEINTINLSTEKVWQLSMPQGKHEKQRNIQTIMYKEKEDKNGI